MDDLPTDEDVARAAEEVAPLPASSPLAALALDVLSRQGEGRALFAGRDFVTARAAEHGATADAAKLGDVDIADALAKGPSTSRERALVAALAVKGLELRLRESPEAAATRLRRFVTHADYLAAWTPYALWSFVPRVLSKEDAAAVFDALEDALGEDRPEGDADRTALAARAAARLEALTRADDATARLARVAGAAKDTTVRALATALGGGAPAAASLRGTRAPARRSPVRQVLALLSGVALVVWASRGIAFLVGLRREATLALESGALRVTTRTSWLGRTMRERVETWSLASISGAARESRWAGLPLAAGALALALGVVGGGLLGLDGVRTGDPGLVVIAAFVVLGGAALDLGLDVLARGLRGRVRVEIALAQGPGVAVERVSAGDADAFVAALAVMLARRAPRLVPADATIKDSAP